MSGEPIELILPLSIAADDVVARVGDRFDVHSERARRVDRVVLDTFDRRLRARGLWVERRPARRSMATTITLVEAGVPVGQAAVISADRYLVGDLPAGLVRDRIAAVVGVRALLSVARIRSRTRVLSVRNRAGKTVAHLVVEHAEAVAAGRPPTPLVSRMHVRRVLGYDKRLARIVGVLTDELGFVPAGTVLIDEAVLALGGRPEGVSSKVTVALVPGMRADEAVGAVLACLADVAESNLAGTLDDLDSEFLHDLRVAVRRARSVLREIRDVHPPAQRSALREELRWIQSVTGPTRDLDVQLGEWDELCAALPPGRASDLSPLHDLLTGRRAQARRTLRRDLRSHRFGQALGAWRALAGAAPAGPETTDRAAAALPIEVLAAQRVRAVYRRMVRDGARIGADSPPEALHDLRKRGKELRYLLELFGVLFPGKVVKPMVSTLKDLQDVLGRFQDRAVQAEMLRGLGDELATAEGGPAALMALGLVVEALLADQRAARAAFAQRFAAFSAPAQRKLVKATFAQPTAG